MVVAGALACASITVPMSMSMARETTRDFRGIVLPMDEDADTAVEAGKVLARKALSVLSSMGVVHPFMEVQALRLSGHPNEPSELGRRVAFAGAQEAQRDRGNRRGGLSYVLTGEMTRVGEDVFLNPVLVRQDGTLVHVEPVHVQGLGRRSHEGILSSSRPW